MKGQRRPTLIARLGDFLADLVRGVADVLLPGPEARPIRIRVRDRR